MNSFLRNAVGDYAAGSPRRSDLPQGGSGVGAPRGWHGMTHYRANAVSWSDGPVDVLVGDVTLRLEDIKDESVQCVVTSPPYWGLRDYGMSLQLGLESTPDLYVKNMADVFNEVRRVLRKDGTLWLNLGDSYASGRSGQNGDMVHHSTLQGGRPASLPHKGAVGLDGLKPKDLCGIPWRLAFALQAGGWYLRSDIIWSKPNPMPESITDRPTKAHEYLFLLTKSERYYYDADAIRETAQGGQPYGATAGNWSLQAQGSLPSAPQGAPRCRMVGTLAQVVMVHRNGREAGEPGLIRDGRNKRSVWTIATQPYPEAHFATFPEALVEPCILAGSREGDTVLDPFAGSGTTLAVARRLGRKAIGIELQPDYLPLIQKRVRESALPLMEAIADAV